jgi:hypothetical protein
VLTSKAIQEVLPSPLAQQQTQAGKPNDSVRKASVPLRSITDEPENAVEAVYTLATKLLEYLEIPGPVSRWLPPLLDIPLREASTLRFAGRCYAQDVVDAMLESKPAAFADRLTPGVAGVVMFIVSFDPSRTGHGSPLTLNAVGNPPKALVEACKRLTVMAKSPGNTELSQYNGTPSLDSQDQSSLNRFVFDDSSRCEEVPQSCSGPLAMTPADSSSSSPSKQQPAGTGKQQQVASGKADKIGQQPAVSLIRKLAVDAVDAKEDIFGRWIAKSLQEAVELKCSASLTAGCVSFDVVDTNADASSPGTLPLWVFRW